MEKREREVNLKWLREFKKKGIFAFDKNQLSFLQVLKAKYQRDYTPFLEQLEFTLGVVSADPRTAAIVKNVKTEIEKSFNTIDKLLGSKGLIATSEEATDLYYGLEYIESSIEELSALAASNVQTQQAISRVEKQTGISFENLAKTQPLIVKRYKGLIPSKPFAEKKAAFAARHPELYGLGREMLGGITGAFGPYGTAAKWMGTTITGYLKRRREAKLEKEAGGLAQRLLPAELTTPERAMTLKEALMGGIPTPRAVRPEELIRRKTGPEVTAGSQPLYQFFNEGAYKAKWTKKVLSLLSLFGGLDFMKKETKKEERKFLKEKLEETPLKNVKNFAVFLGPLLSLLAGLGMGVWDIKKGLEIAKKEGWLRKPGEELAKGQKVAIGIGSFLGGTGPGIFDKGTIGQKAKNIAWGALKGGLIGGGLIAAGALLAPLTGGVSLGAVMAAAPAIMTASAGSIAGGAALGASIGAGIHGFGGKRISQGIQETTRLLNLQNPVTGQSLINFQNQVQSDLFKNIEQSGTKIINYNSQMLEELKNISKYIFPKISGSNYQAKDSGDPLVEALNQGNVSVD